MVRLVGHLFGMLFLACCVACSAPQSSDPPAAAQDEVDAGTGAQEREAAAAAKMFFNEMDADHMEETWVDAGPVLKASTNEQMWVATLRACRSAVGQAVHRKIKGFGFTHHLAHAPPGDYVAMVFNTQFADVTAEEKVVFQKDQDHWKVIGYFLSKTIKVQL